MGNVIRIPVASWHPSRALDALERVEEGLAKLVAERDALAAENARLRTELGRASVLADAREVSPAVTAALRPAWADCLPRAAGLFLRTLSDLSRFDPDYYGAQSPAWPGATTGASRLAVCVAAGMVHALLRTAPGRQQMFRLFACGCSPEVLDTDWLLDAGAEWRQTHGDDQVAAMTHRWQRVLGGENAR